MTCPTGLIALATVLCCAPAAAQDGGERSLASYRAHLAAAEAALRDGDAKAAREWLDAAPSEHAGWELRALRARTDECLAEWSGHAAAIHAVAWSPTGELLASASDDGTLRVWYTATGQTLRRLSLRRLSLRRLSLKEERPRAVAWDAGGERLACATVEGSLVLFDAATGEELVRAERAPARVTTANRTPNAIVWSPTGAWIALVRAGQVDVHDAETGEIVRQVTGTRPWPLACSARFNAGGEELVTFFWDGLLEVRDTASGEVLRRRDPPATLDGFHAYHDLRFDPSGLRLGAAGFDGSVRVHTLEGGEDVEGEIGGVAQCYAVAFTPDGARIVAGYARGAVRSWDPATGTLEKTWLGHTGPVYALDVSPDGGRLASGAADGSLRLWDAAGLRGATLAIDAGDAVWSAPYSPDGRLVATAASDGRAVVWHLATGDEVNAFGPFEREVTSVDFTPDGARLAVASNETIVRVFDLAGVAQPLELRGHTNGVPNLEVGPNGRWLASASYDRSVRIWDLARGETVHTLALDAYDCAFSSDGTRLATNDGREVVVFDVDSGAELARLTESAHPGGVRAVAWSPDGTLLASGCQEGSLRVVDVATGRTLLARQAHGATIYGIAFHPDGSRFATASYDGTVRIWSPAAPAELATFRDLGAKAYFVEFSPDGRQLAASTIDGRVTVWSTERLRDRDAGR